MADATEADRRADPAGPGRRDSPELADAGRTAATTGPGGAAVTPDDPARRSALGQLAVQAKSTVGAANDPMELEADGVADRVMRAMAAPAENRTEPGAAPPAPAAPEPVPPAPTAAPAPPSTANGPTPPAPARPTAPSPTPAAGPDRLQRQTDESGGEDVVQASRSEGTVSDRVQSMLDASVGRGVPLPDAARKALEPGFGRDLGTVRIHDDEAAHSAAASLGALAFTRGRDIYLAAGAYDPDSEAGRRLLAHEITHVIQQTGAQPDPTVRRRLAPPKVSGDSHGHGVVRRAKGAKKEKTKAADGTAESDTRFKQKDTGSTIDTASSEVKLYKVPIPKVKVDTIKVPAKVRKPEERKNRSSALYTKTWSEAAKAKLGPKLTSFLGSAEGKAAKGKGQDGVYYLKLAGSGEGENLTPYVGTESELKEALWRPLWEPKKGSYARFQIDHRTDHALGGEDGDIGNLWLLEAVANMRLGRMVLPPVLDALGSLVAGARKALTKKPPTAAKVESTYKVYVETFKSSGDKPDGHPEYNWSVDDMGSDAITKYLKAVKDKERKRLTGDKQHLAIYSRSFGASVKSLPFKGLGETAVKGWSRGRSFEVTSVVMDKVGPDVVVGQPVGRLKILPFKGNDYAPNTPPVDLPIIGMSGVPYGGAASTREARNLLKAAFPKASPIDVESLDFDVSRGFVGRGVIRPTLSVLRNAELAVIFDGGIAIEASLSGGELSLPGPLRITSGQILARIGSEQPRPQISGRLFFEIEKLASGDVALGFDLGTGFSFDGSLSLETDFFEEAKVKVGYKKGEWSVEGKLAIGPNKVTGISHGSATVSLQSDKLVADGEFKSSLKGLQGGRLGLTQDENGTTITGALTLGKLPGIEGGEIKATVSRRKQGDGWSLAGELTARPSVPGVTGSITGRYEDGAFLAEADLGYKRGLLDGRLKIGVTNQSIVDGKPSGPPVPDLLLIYGMGRASLQLTPWLVGTAAVELRPNGTVAVAGRIALPDRFTLFERRELNKPLTPIGIDIPIVGLSVAGQRIGIFATIRGGLDLVAGIGPGQLLGTGVEVNYDPEREDATTVEGDTSLVVPADAGLRLYVRGGVGAGIPVVSATAGVELGGELGLAGQLTAGLHLLWTRSRGLVLDAEASLFVQPRFRFTADIFAQVTLDVYFYEKDLYNRKWALAAFEFGSDLRFGVILPVHAEGGQFDFSFDRMRFEYPSIDPKEIARGVLGHILDR